jgi:hypothetical protein
MPLHDWTRVDAGIYHDFHTVWMTLLRLELARGLLPPDYYVLIEQQVREDERYGIDVLALYKSPAAPPAGTTRQPRTGGGLALRTPPQVGRHLTHPRYRHRTLVVRHVSGNRVVALIELASPGNKDRAASVEQFVTMVRTALDAGVSVVVLDPFLPGKHDPLGLPGAVWEAVGGAGYDLPPDRRLTFASFAPGGGVDLYADHLRPGDPLPQTPLFLAPGEHVPLPLGPTYDAAYDGADVQYKQVLEAG